MPSYFYYKYDDIMVEMNMVETGSIIDDTHVLLIVLIVNHLFQIMIVRIGFIRIK